MNFTPQISRIKGLSDRRRLPRLGKIRLGFKIKKGDKEYPAELPFFLLPDEVAKIYGGKVGVDRAKALGATRQDVLDFVKQNEWRLAEEIEIMLPINLIDAVFPQAYKWYGKSKGVKCMGDGEHAMRYNEEARAMLPMDCPCEKLKTDENPKGECTQRAHLLCLVPRVNMGGIYQIDLGSLNSIVDLNSGIDYVTAMIGRFAMVPLTLRRIPTETHHDNQKQIHFTMQLIMNVPIGQIENLRRDTARILTHSEALLIQYEDVNPASEPADIEVEPENGEKNNEKQPEPSLYEFLASKIQASNTLDELKTSYDACQEMKDKLKKDERKALEGLKNERKEKIGTLAPVEEEGGPTASELFGGKETGTPIEKTQTEAF